MSKSLILWTLFIAILCACNNADRKEAKIKSVYYWKYNGPQNDLDTQVLRHYGFQHFYVKLMDVAFDPQSGKASPKARLDQSKALEQAWNLPHTPVVFINNNCFLNMDSAASRQLALDIDRYIKSYYRQLNVLYKDKIPEWNTLQIDCDWTRSSKDRYFYFLQELKALNPQIKLSATLRMYPYKYPGQMGVPPVDELSLMCYNLGKIKDFNTVNSILDVNEFRTYLGNQQAYPKPLHIALPCFGWMAWFRNGTYQHILYLTEDQLGKAHFARKANSNKYMAIKDTVIAGQYIRVGDILRSEWPSAHDLEAAIDLVSRKEKNIKGFSYFHYDTVLFKKYESVIKEQK
ncbi:MAG: hypothetical protein JNM21_02870 [Taibaiella sp.]|nr:hypothetical protein [Taibaiella sp.]